MIKKIAAILLGGLLVFTAAACANDNPSSQPEQYPIEDVTLSDGIDRTKVIDMLAEGGESDYRIVYSAAATSAESYAATELVTFLGDATGANLQMVVDSAVEYDPEGRFISVGNTALSERAGIVADAEELNRDGFVVQTVGSNLYILGANDRGTIYGVYDFLEKMIGVRFISGDVTYIPEVETLPLYETNIKEAPAFEYRNLYSYSMRTDDVLYTRLRFNAPERTITDMYGGKTDWYTEMSSEVSAKYDNLLALFPSYPTFNVIHNAFYYVNPADWYVEHPEFFARDENGNIIRDAAGTICQPNLLNGMTEEGTLDESMEVSVAKIALESLKTFILDDPDATVFFFGYNDWEVYDRTPESVAAEEKYGGQSGILIRFMNMLSSEIEEWMAENNIDREITLATFAYLHTKRAPVEEDGSGGWKAVDPSVIPAENVAIRLAPIELDWYYSVNDENQLEEYRELIEQWTYITDNFMVWTYETNFGNYLFYYPSMRQWSDNLRYFRDIGATYMMMQDNYHGYGSWQAEMHTYVASRLLWNPDRKVQPLIDEFLYHYFGEKGAAAVAEMMQIYDEQFALLQADYEDFWVPFRDDSGTTLMNPDYFPISLLERAESLIEDAIAANASDPDITDRERTLYDRHLTSALLTPQAMILHNYAAYYSGSKTPYAAEFITNAEYVGVLALSEVKTLIQYKAELGLS